MAENISFSSDIVWRPSQDRIQRSHLKKFMEQHNLGLFQDLLDQSTQDIAWFTDAVIRYLDIQFQTNYDQVVDLSQGIQFPKWCLGGQMNIIHNCVDKWAANSTTRTRTAVIWEGEEGITQALTYSELSAQVNRCANALRELGYTKGDVIGIYMPMTPEIVIALLAIAKIGGIILPLFSGYGVGAIVSRLLDANAKCLFTADGFFRRGKIIPLKPIVDEAILRVSSIQHTIVLNRAGNPVAMQAGRDHWWHELISQQPEQAENEPTEAEDILMIIYTSGTTGQPKGAVHTHCGFPVKAAQDMAFGMDVQFGDILYWITDLGWMMGPWLIFGTLLLGATGFIFDGALDYPAPNRIWGLVERHKITGLGVSPTLIRSLMAQSDQYIKGHDLSALKIFGSTGEPWNPGPWMWLFDSVGKRQRPIINYSGGTEISGGILMGNPILPLKPAAFSAPCPGIAADILDETGQSVRNQVGELVIRAPWIGMTRGFWGDNQRYLDTYWSRWENIWVHGDWAMVDDDGLWYILGRSDDTIKIAGKRLGPAEIESVLVNHPAVVEAAAIGIPDVIKGSAVICFCVLDSNYKASNELRAELKLKVVAEMGKPLQPKDIKFVSDLPKTRNSKVMRRIIRNAYLGDKLGDTSSLLNPEAVQEIEGAR